MTDTTLPRPDILVVDDDRDIGALLAEFLGRHNMAVRTAANGAEMRAALAEGAADLIVLDLMLPDDDGLTLCRELRRNSRVPIIMLTAMGEDTDRIVGLEVGCDDYVAKPFNPRELLARIRAVLRRSADTPPGDDGALAADKVLLFGDWRLDTAARTLSGPDGPVELSTGEFDLLVVFAQHRQRVLSRDQLLDLLHGRVAGPFDRSIDVQVSRLRRKIEPDPKAPSLIRTVRNEGYLFTPEVRRP